MKLSDRAFPMNTLRQLLLMLAAVITITGCADKEAAERKAREDAEAKARAEAARKEMERLPETFKPRYNKKLEPSAPSPTEAEKKTEAPKK